MIDHVTDNSSIASSIAYRSIALTRTYTYAILLDLTTISSLLTMDPSHKQVQASNEPMQTSLNSSEVEKNANNISYQKYSDVRCLDLFGEWRRCVCESCHARKRDSL